MAQYQMGGEHHISSSCRAKGRVEPHTEIGEEYHISPDIVVLQPFSSVNVQI